MNEEKYLSLRETGLYQSKMIGTCAEADFLDDARFANVLKNEFSLVAPETSSSWKRIHPMWGHYNFEPVEKLLEYTERHNMKMCGGPFVWWGMLPNYLGGFTDHELRNELSSHIETVMTQLSGRISAWHVANNLFYTNTGEIAESLLTKGSDLSIVYLTYDIARKYNDGALLGYNDEWGSKRYRERVLAFARDVGVDFVGMQMHLALPAAPYKFDEDALDNFIYALEREGIGFRVTEMDVRIPTPTHIGDYERQAELYYQIAKVCMRHENCDAFSVWGVGDSVSWIPSYYHGYGDALLFDANYNPKDAFFAVKDALSGRELEKVRWVRSLTNGS